MDLPKGFEELPREDQTRVRVSGEAIVRMAQQHAGGLIIAPPPSRDGFFGTGSFCVLQIDGRHWLATALHVIEHFEKAVADDPTVEIQIGEMRTRLDDRECLRDKAADVCLVALAAVEAPLTRLPVLSAAAGWPPPRPHEGDYVALSGYPKIVRQRPTRKAVDFNALSTLFRVTAVGEHHCTCQFERAEWISFDGPPPPEPGTDLAGMSGGPVLLIRGLVFPVVGVISEFWPGFAENGEILPDSEILRIGLFQPPVFGDFPEWTE
jgi:hypothetical protein